MLYGSIYIYICEVSIYYDFIKNIMMSCHEFIGDAWKALFELAGGFIREYDHEAMVSLSKCVDQLPSVMNQVLNLINFFCYSITELLYFHTMSYKASSP
jgi:hypothetical protein